MAGKSGSITRSERMAKWNEILRIEELMFQARAWRPIMIWRAHARSDHPVTKTVRSVRRQSSVDRAGGVFACRSIGGRRWSAANWRAPRHLAGSGAAVQASTTIVGAPGLAWPMMRAEG
ncbi:hypothetical protein [Mesorhizobium sp. M0698]|uniref:hypothetical protein n=1 Tax=Mesorhizobium sp. M0698 TaxID=2956987 RepID=UPI0033351461